jgi:hypothetical protein
MVPEEDMTGTDDQRAMRALAAWHDQAAPSVAFHTVKACARCANTAMVGRDGLCMSCRDDDAWSALNRAVCDLVHRGGAPRSVRRDRAA